MRVGRAVSPARDETCALGIFQGEPRALQCAGPGPPGLARPSLVGCSPEC